jgi:hypothetical protein
MDRTRKHIETARLKPSPENQILYNSRGPDHPDLRGLIESIRERGIEARLLVSRDDYIISGHNRWQAAQHLGLLKVPCEIIDIRRSDCSTDQWARLLREHNHGRTKTFDELTREALVDVTEDDILRAARDKRAMRSDGAAEAIQITAKRRSRHGISKAKRPFCDAIKKVLIDLGDDKPVSVRAVHYGLLKDPPWRNTGLKIRHANDRESYDDVSDMLTRLRLNGEIPFDWIVDENRPVLEWETWDNSGQFIGEKSKDLFSGYARNLLQSQRVFYVVIAEKLTVKAFLQQTCAKYCVPLVISRGNSSIELRNQLAQRFRKSAKDSMHLFVLGDCDADGDSIVQSFLQSMRDEFDIETLTGDRVAISHEQADELQLPRTLDAKESSSNFNAFVQRHGRTDAYELESVPPAQLRQWLDQAIRARLDLASYNREVDEQQAELRHIVAKKKVILNIVRDNSH